MADKKKTNLPTVKLSGPEVDRREVLRGGLATVGRALMPSLPGAIADLTPADIISTTNEASPMSIPAAFSQLLWRSDKLSESVASMTEQMGHVADGNAMAEAAGDVITGGYTPSFYDAIDQMDQWEADEPYEPYPSRLADLNDMANEVDDDSRWVEMAMKDLKRSFKAEYPDDFVDWLFDTGIGRSIFAKEITDIQYALQDAEFTEHGHPLQSWKLPYQGGSTKYLSKMAMEKGEDPHRKLTREELNEDQRNSLNQLTNLVIPNLVQKAIPEYEKEKKVKIKDIPWEAIPENTKLPSPVEERIKDVGKTVGIQALGRLLTQLADKKDTKSKGPKQITGPKETEKPSINKLLTALSIFKRGTPLGAAAYVMGPTATAEDDDYDFEIPVDR